MNPLLRLFTASELHWFERNPDDSNYLDLWRDATLNYTPPDNLEGWHIDHHEMVILQNATEAVFQLAHDRLLRYDFYPPTVMRHISTFERAGRLAEVGDRIVLRIHALQVVGLPVADVLALNEIVRVVDEPRRVGFTYMTTTRHSEQGEWSIAVEWRDDDSLALVMDSIARPLPREPRLIRPFIRSMQKRAHRLGMARFKWLILSKCGE